MSDDKKPDLRKSFPGGFIWLLMAAFLFALMLQNYIETKFAKVSFSYELEHLVNLQLIQPEDSRKTALNDNLVTFAGKFREKQTEEGKTRFKYLELLNENHELNQEKETYAKDLLSLRGKISESADWFLHLSGIPIPPGGYVIVDELYNSPGQDHSVVIHDLSKKNITSLADLKSRLATLQEKPTEEGVKTFGADLSTLIGNFRSQQLGIGSEAVKQTLKAIDAPVVEINESTKPLSDKLALYSRTLGELSSVVASLNEVEDHIRLLKLRSVRNYKEAIDQYNAVATRLEENQIQLDKARIGAAQVVWYFNNQEMSTRTLEKQDPEVFHQWFVNAREEWDNFGENKRRDI